MISVVRTQTRVHMYAHMEEICKRVSIVYKSNYVCMFVHTCMEIDALLHSDKEVHILHM